MNKVELKKRNNVNLEMELQASLKNEDFYSLVKRCKLPKDVVLKNNSKLQDTVLELSHCKDCKGLSYCKNKVNGYVFYPDYSNNTLKFLYLPCKYQKELMKDIDNKQKKLDVNKTVRMKDIDINDKNRVKVIKWLKKFYDNYEPVNTLKGLYLHGNFGCGKTYLVSALLNELAVSKNAHVETIDFAKFLMELKNDFSSVEDRVSYLENVDILLIDDIGSENVTAWGRDEILGTILQYRMNNKLSTFFTSNFNIEELEKTLSTTKSSEDLVKARRIIERIKNLCDIEEMISLNRRK